MTGAAKNTVVKLLAEIGDACAEYHNRHVRNLRVRRLQCDEIWCFVGAKAKTATLEQKQQGWGDIWTWVGIDADTKLVVVLFGRRTRCAAGRWSLWKIVPVGSKAAYRSRQTATTLPRSCGGRVWDGCGLRPAPEDLRRVRR